MSHWNKECSHKLGHAIDNQGYCHTCGAEQVPDYIWLVFEHTGDEPQYMAAFSTEQAARAYADRHGPDFYVARKVLDP